MYYSTRHLHNEIRLTENLVSWGVEFCLAIQWLVTLTWTGETSVKHVENVFFFLVSSGRRGSGHIFFFPNSFVLSCNQPT